ncbi:MAG: orotate phosphoribosyltransferase [Candidatus Peribacteraceae bacterium]|jgi:orotate phosphoribosyltransferase|nr:orotate phosphoribosyltransferase [Candidatus Peribacteraceae bacterium]|tara:strand:- start:3057 stop:3692 length:636 start_codon:yes stop_codon:yes gene_type:complete
MPHSKRIAELLVDIGAVKLSIDPPFTWTSGIKSPIYCDNRMIYSHPEARNFVVDALVARIKSLHIDPDCLAGTATAAIGWAALVADRMDLPFVYVRSKAKEHGAKKRIEGDLKEGWDVVVVEDLISTGGSAVSTVEALREEGGVNVTDVVAIFTYEMLVANEKAQNASVKFHPVADFSTLLDIALEQGRLGSEEIDRIATFAQNPKEWGES